MEPLIIVSVGYITALLILLNQPWASFNRTFESFMWTWLGYGFLWTVVIAVIYFSLRMLV